jgi:hypothetical protein
VRCVLHRLLTAMALLAASAVAQQSYPFQGRVVDEKPLDAAHSVVLLDSEKPGPSRWALYIVSNKDNSPVLALDTSGAGTLAASPTLEVIGPRFVYLHFHSDYGIYRGSLKYVIDVSSSKPPAKIQYGILALNSVERQGDRLHYSASFNQPGQIFEDGWHEQHATIILQPRDSALPTDQIVEGGVAAEQVATGPTTLTGPGGEAVQVANVTPPGQPDRPSVIFVDKKPYPAPIPTLDLWRQKRHDEQPPGEMQSDIGPFVQQGDKIWFATTFYDGEGVSGIGAIGAFDIASRKYEMRYLPEIAPWSGSAIRLDGDSLWIGLKRQPEGAVIGGGLLRYTIATGKAQVFAVPDVVFTIDRVGDALYCGTSHGLYMVRGDRITQLRFEPDESGQLVMIAREVPPAGPAQPSAR